MKVSRRFSFKKSHDLTVENIIKIQEDLEQTRLSGNEVAFKDPTIRKEQFQATKRWNVILSTFYNKMPKKKNRRQLRYYADTFTGKEACDFLLELFPRVILNKSFDEKNAEKFMQLLITKNLIENVRDMNDKTFHSNACLYKFIDEKIKEEIDATKPMQRASSLTDLKSLAKSESFVNDFNKLSKLRRSTSIADISQSINELNINQNTPKMKEINLMDPRQEYNRIRVRSPQSSHPMDVQVDGIDYLFAWKHLLLKLVNIPSICQKLEENVDGEEIKWNSTQIGLKGIVKCPNINHDLPNDIKKDFQILNNWKLNDENNTELLSSKEIFNHLYRNLSIISPIVPHSFSSKLALLWKHFNKKITIDNNDDYDNISNMSNYFNNRKDTFSISDTTNSSIDSTGLKYIDENIGYRTRRHKPGIVNNQYDAKKNLYGAIQVLLLSLKPDIRRKLNIVCRYIKRISSNEELKLNETKSNLQFLLERLGPCLIDFSVNLSLKDGLFLILTLVESHTLLFSESEVLMHSARRFYLSRMENAESPFTPYFCERISSTEFHSSQGNTDLALLTLLDSIIADENMQPSEKKKKLESFKTTYPHLYLKRFPNEALNIKDDANNKKKIKRNPTPANRIVQGIRSLTRKDSSRN